MRYIGGAVIAILVSGGLFYFMSFLISGEANIKKSDDDIKFMNFIRVKHEKPLEAKKRVIPKEPKPIKEPPKPKISTAKTEAIQQDIDIQMPKIDMVFDVAKDGLSGVSVAQSFADISSNIAVNLMPIFKIPPRYPTRAKMLKKEGFVELEFTITKEGFVENIVVIKSKPKGIFENSALNALSKWKFKPKIISGNAIEQRAKQTIEYRLSQ